MASVVAQNWECMDGHDNSKNFELSQINYNLVITLFDEDTQVEDCDDERLTKVIRSLEAEIGFEGQCGNENAVWESDVVDYQSTNNEPKSQDQLLSHENGDLHYWLDMETMPTPPSGDMGSWYMVHEEEGMMMSGVNEFGGLKNYAHVCCGTPLEEQDYGSLWHETNVSFIQ